MNSIERLQALMHGKTADHLLCMPIMMLWAAEFEGVSYEDYVRDYNVLCRCQLRLVEEFGFDIVQLISDPFRETADMGAPLQYYPAGPPRCLVHVLADKSAFAGLSIPDPLGGGRMTDRVRGAHYLHERVGGEIPVMGWVEGPIAQAVDMRGMQAHMFDLVDDLSFVEDLYDWITEMEIAFAAAQVEAGCGIIGIGDAAASLVSAEVYETLVLPREQRIVRAVQQAGAVARLHICGNTSHLLELLPKTGCEIIDLDHLFDIELARPAMGPEPVILGNFDPVKVLLQGSPEDVHNWCERCHKACGERHIVGPGCEVAPGTPRVNIEIMRDYAKGARL